MLPSIDVIEVRVRGASIVVGSSLEIRVLTMSVVAYCMKFFADDC